MNSDLDAATDIIQARAGFEPIEAAIVLGAGLGEAVEALEGEVSIPYADLPGFPSAKAFGQEGRLVIGNLEGVRIACLKGRSHYFENGDPRGMALPLEVLTMIGVGNLIVTTSGGSADADIFPGSLAIVMDHINFNGLNPLVGVQNDGGAISLAKAYDERLTRRLKRAAQGSGIAVRDCTYLWLSGPTFETAAETRMTRALGANVIGMAGIEEIILARRLGLRACAVAAITHFCAGFNKSDPSYLEIRETARNASISLRRLIRAFLRTKEGGFAVESKAPSLLLRKPITS